MNRTIRIRGIAAVGAAILVAGTLAACGDGDQIKSLQDRIAKLEARAIELGKENAALSAKTADAAQAAKVLETRVGEIDGRVKALKTAVDGALAALKSEVQASLAKSGTDVDAFKKEISSSLAKTDGTIAEFKKEVEGTIEKAGADITGVKETLSALTQDIKAIKSRPPTAPTEPAVKPAE